MITLSLSLLCTLSQAEENLEKIRETQGSLVGMDMEDLLGLTVTSASKKEQKLSEVATAITVVTKEDIQRLGATNIPEILRSVPGIQVAKVSANEWAVTARGFLGVFSTKLLVLIDGRSVYTPVFSGVVWDELDLVLEDIERIEVIRGPGATVWGSNAVNGVINIITKSAVDTHGGLLVAGAGNEERAFGSLRYGGAFGNDINYRFFIKASERDSSINPQGEETHDDWNSHSAGFRMEWDGSNDSLLADGRIYYGHKGVTIDIPTLTPPFRNTINKKYQYDGGHFLTQWEHDWSSTSEHKLQLFFDRVYRDDPKISREINTVDLEFDHRFQFNQNQEINWGLGYRHINLQMKDGLTGSSQQTQYDFNLYTGFVQSEWRLLDESVIFTLGSKIEHHYYTGLNVQPSARIAWVVTPTHSLWGSISRAVRTPSFSENELKLDLFTISGGLANIFLTLDPLHQQDNEELLAYEIGHRFNPSANFFINTSLYFHDFSQITSFELGALSAPNFVPTLHVNQPILLDTLLEGKVYGVEIDSKWNPFEYWQLNFSYTYSKMDLKRKSGVEFISPGYASENGSPQQLVSVGSRFDLPYHTTLDFWFRYNDKITRLASSLENAKDSVKSYITLDIQATWQPINSLKLSLVGQNLLDKHRVELIDELSQSARKEMERSFYFKFSWQF